MNRREFSKLSVLSSVALATRNVFAQSRTPQISVTMDDFSWQNAVYQPAADRNRSILAALDHHSIKAALFVVGRNVESDEGKHLLEDWNAAGHLIGNHTYSHPNLNSPSMKLATYTSDIARAETFLKDFSRFKKYFRFPMLKEGETAEKRDGVRAFLAQHGYRVGHVTIDTSDWIITSRLSDRLAKDPTTNTKPYRDYYLAHMWDRAQFYDDLARRVVGRPVKHTILTHYNLLNGLFLNDLIEMFKSKGWQFIDAEEAFTDPVFAEKPKVLPAGESIVWSLAQADQKIARTLKYPAEEGSTVEAEMKKLGL
jgi:peptidoglycan/xylan/chitin deacetylase (PgdA/CDA1 family)